MIHKDYVHENANSCILLTDEVNDNSGFMLIPGKVTRNFVCGMLLPEKLNNNLGSCMPLSNQVVCYYLVR